MQLLFPSRSCRQSGYGLIITLAFVAVLLIVFASMLLWTSSNAKITLRNNLFNESENAAESATETILAYMMQDFNSASLNTSNYYAGIFPPTNGWPVYYQFSDTNGNTSVAATVTIGQFSTNAEALNSQFAGLYGIVMPCTIASTATPLGQGQNLSATVCQTIQFALIPLFQFAIFYNIDLEINPGAGMKINGHVHSNQTIWATGSGSSTADALIFSNYVDAASGVFLQSSTNDPHNNRSGNVIFAITNNNPIGNADVLSLPIGAATTNDNEDNVLAILNPPPASYATGTSGAYHGDGTNYLENQADLIITNLANGTSQTFGTNILIYYQNPNMLSSPTIPILPDVPKVTVTREITGTNYNKYGGVSSYTYGPYMTNLNYTWYSFATNVSFHDYRESKTVQALQIDVAAFDQWLTNNPIGGTNRISVPGRGLITLDGTNTVSLTWAGVSNDITAGFTNLGGTNIIYRGYYFNYLKTNILTRLSSKGLNSIYVLNNVPTNSAQLPAVRMVNGTNLPAFGLTVVTPDPIYVLGSYNTTTNYGANSSTILGDTANTYPAALMGDAVTILSDNWKDTYTSSTSLSSRSVTAANTTINVATLEGIVPSDGVNYSGGVENFLRLLENWNSSNNTLTYNGSIIVMFKSRIATSPWQTTGVYYNPPNRKWGFDLNFNIAKLLPPLTPNVKATIRGTWSAW